MSAPLSPPDFSRFADVERPITASAADRAAFGQFLSSARHRAGRSLEDIAATTKVAVRQLEALEQGDIEQLPAGVYRRAIVRNYASAVGLRPDLAIEQFDRTFNPAPRPVEQRGSGRAARHDARQAPSRPPRGIRIAPLPGRFGRVAVGVAVVLAAGAIVAILKTIAPAPDNASTDAGAGRGSGTGDPAAATPGPAANATQTSGSGTALLEGGGTVAEVVVNPRLVITSNPSGARVTVNGIGWGVTPVTIRNLPPGTKVIRATKDGYVGRETSVEFGTTGGNATVRLVLRPQN